MPTHVCALGTTPGGRYKHRTARTWRPLGLRLCLGRLSLGLRLRLCLRLSLSLSLRLRLGLRLQVGLLGKGLLLLLLLEQHVVLLLLLLLLLYSGPCPGGRKELLQRGGP